MAEHGDTPRFMDRRGICGIVDIDLHNLLSSLRFGILIAPTQKLRPRRRKGKDVLPTFAMPGAAEMRPGFAILRALERIRSGCGPVAPVDFEASECGDLAKVDFHPRVL